MKRLCKSSNKSVVELSEDIIIEILHGLPSKSLARFIRVCKHWQKCIADPSLAYSCRSQRWSPHPTMIGFFCQSRVISSEIRFLDLSSKTSSEVIDGSLDELVNFLGRRLYIIASSNGFLLIAEKRSNQRVYYVYNPATRQHFSVPVTETSCMKVAAIGFDCKVDDPEKDVISFTIVRYEIWYFLRSSVTIESFSSETNVWTTIYLTLVVPLKVCLSCYRKLASAGVIDGVFCWIDHGAQIIFYDSVNRQFWALRVNALEPWYLGVSDGVLCYASLYEGKITMWCLESNIRSPDAVWVRKYDANLIDALRNNPPLGLEAAVMCVDIHPANPHIVYLKINGTIVSYDLEKNIMEFLYEIRDGNYLFFTYEWHQWPRLL
ncbi:F-box protein At5g03970-like [Solanum verrucosum]|uniref:F-box protein At5g03970-like n=1 Tax=Solanum verrucosum TaxID=315347 RepID=UPI0020D1519D|nr:F-box protein At5g03970-like [Solanum verrucosum]